MNIHNYLPNGKRDLKRAGCEDSGCSGSGFAFLIGGSFDEDGEILCKNHFRDRQNTGKVEKAEDVFTLE